MKKKLKFYIITFLFLFLFHNILYVIKINSILIIIPSDVYYINIIRNFYFTNIIPYNLTNIFIVVAYTNEMYIQCKKYNIPVEKMDKQIEEDSNSYKITAKNFIKKTRLKHPIIYKYIQKCDYLLFLDADVFFFVNPLTLLKIFNSNADIMMPCDDKLCNQLNYGFLLIRKSNNTIFYIKELINIENNCKSYSWENGEQAIANRYMKNISYVNIQKVDINQFMDGYNFFQYNSFSVEKKKLIGFHNDFTVGIDSKIYRLKELGLYVIDNDEKIDKYIYYNGSTNTNINKTIKLLSNLIALSKIFNRTLILPQFECNMNRKCTFVELFNIECFKKCMIKYKENISF